MTCALYDSILTGLASLLDHFKFDTSLSDSILVGTIFQNFPHAPQTLSIDTHACMCASHGEFHFQTNDLPYIIIKCSPLMPYQLTLYLLATIYVHVYGMFLKHAYTEGCPPCFSELQLCLLPIHAVSDSLSNG